MFIVVMKVTAAAESLAFDSAENLIQKSHKIVAAIQMSRNTFFNVLPVDEPNKQ